MSITAGDISYINQLNNISRKIDRYLLMFLLFFGIFGNLLSCLVFVQKVLRSNPCTLYFLAASVANFIAVTTLLSAMLAAWNPAFNLAGTVSALCKIIMFIDIIARTLALWFIVLATIDRYLASHSNINRRQMRNLKQAYRWITITCVITVLICMGIPFCFDTNVVGAPIRCYTISNACSLFNNITSALITVIIPSSVMLIFGFLTIANIRQSKLKTHPNTLTAIASNKRNRRTESTLTQMLLAQVSLVIVLNLPLAVYTAYLAITFYQPKSQVQLAGDGFMFTTLLFGPYISSCMSFIFYTLSGSVFRQTLMQLGKRIIRRLKCNP